MTSSIRRALVAHNWSKKVSRQRAREQNPDLRESYLHNISDFHSYHLVYVDESGCDKRGGIEFTRVRHPEPGLLSPVIIILKTFL
jgi:hypothetical protein